MYVYGEFRMAAFGCCVNTVVVYIARWILFNLIFTKAFHSTMWYGIIAITAIYIKPPDQLIRNGYNAMNTLSGFVEARRSSSIGGVVSPPVRPSGLSKLYLGFSLVF